MIAPNSSHPPTTSFPTGPDHPEFLTPADNFLPPGPDRPEFLTRAGDSWCEKVATRAEEPGEGRSGSQTRPGREVVAPVAAPPESYAAGGEQALGAVKG